MTCYQNPGPSHEADGRAESSLHKLCFLSVKTDYIFVKQLLTFLTTLPIPCNENSLFIITNIKLCLTLVCVVITESVNTNKHA
jgi:hypothetical protein